MLRICNKCNIEKDITKFHRGKGYALGRKPTCAECTNSFKRTDERRVYDRIRNKTPKRIKQLNKSVKKLRKKYPEKNKARAAVNEYFRFRREDRPKNCCVCGIEGRIELHHEDYSIPLEVYPLCSLCHSSVHRKQITLNDKHLICLKYN